MEILIKTENPDINNLIIDLFTAIGSNETDNISKILDELHKFDLVIDIGVIDKNLTIINI